MDGPFKKSVKTIWRCQPERLRHIALSVVKNKQHAKISGHAGRGAFKEADTLCVIGNGESKSLTEEKIILTLLDCILTQTWH